MEDVSWTQIILALIGLIGGGLVFSFYSKKKIDNSKTVQKGNKVKGDMAGRDIHKKS